MKLSSLKPSNWPLEDIVNGNILSFRYIRMMYGTLIALALFGMIYIGSRYKAQINIKEQRVLTKEIADLRYQYLSMSTELTQMRRGSVVEDSVAKYNPELKSAHSASFMISK